MTSAANWRQPLKWNRAHEMNRAEAERTGYGALPKPRVFCAPLADFLDEEVPIDWLEDLLKLIHDTPNLDWLLLTKRPENFTRRVLMAAMGMAGYVDGQRSCTPEAFADAKESTIESVLGWSKHETCPANVWIGTSVENQAMADKRIPELLKIPAQVRFLSVEPMLEAIDLGLECDVEWFCRECGSKNVNTEVVVGPGDIGTYVCLDCNHGGSGDDPGAKPSIDWVICGGESGPGKRRFDCDWGRSLRDQCAVAGVPFFFKQVDKVRVAPGDLRIREYPRGGAGEPVFIVRNQTNKKKGKL